MADYPNKKLTQQNLKPSASGYFEGNVVDSKVEGRGPEAKTIRMNSLSKNKKSAGTVGNTNMSHA